MKANTIKERSFYTQSQRFAARVLLAVWLLASGIPEGTLATPKRQMVPATTNSPGDPSLPSALPTLPPGGALQLPPESTGSLSGDSVAIDAALQRAHGLRARTIGKLTSLVWRPRPQEAPSTSAEPVAQGVTEGSSSSQHPAVDPSSAVATSSTATPSALQQLMSQRGVPDNDTLLAALNAEPQEQRQWIEAAIKWFATQPIETLSPVAIQDYALLAHVQVTPENRELLKRYFNSLCNKVKDGSFGEELLIQALAYALAHIDIAVFAGDPTPLLDLGINLLAKLKRSENAFTQKTYPTDRITLEALFQTLFLAQKLDPGQLGQKEGSLYQNFSNQLTDLAAVTYYPVKYHAQILKQTLELLAKIEDPSKRQQAWKACQAVFRFLEAGIYSYQAMSNPLTPLIESDGLTRKIWNKGILNSKPGNVEAAFKAFKEGCAKIKEIVDAQHEQARRSWYAPLFQIYAESEILKKDAGAWDSISELLKKFEKKKIRNPEDRKALRFGLAMHLQTLVLQGSTREVRQKSIERLIALAKPKAWGADADVLAGLLDGLALVATQSQTDPDRTAEVAMARKVLEALAAEPPLNSSVQPWWNLKRLLHRPQAPQDAASRAFSAWLGEETLSAKLQGLREQTTQPAPSDEERLFSHVKRTLRRTATIESFRAQEIVSLSQLSSYIALAKLRHFVERISITEQLSATLSHKGVCVLYGFGGAGKSTLAAHYGHARKETQTVRWIGAENSFKLRAGYEQLAQELRVDYQPLAKKLAADDSQYRQDLARMVYNALARNSQPTLLILDNAQDASLIEDYLLPRPDAIQAIITTRSAEAFEGTYEQLQLSAFSQDEGQHYLEARFKAMKRPYNNPEVASLLEEVGLVPQKLNLAAGYLQANKMATTAQYIARLQALKQAGTKQQGKLTLPEVALGLEKLTKEGQQLMQYAAYLDADFIPRSLASALLGADDPEQLSEVASDLSRLSLMQVVYNENQELGLQVHREVQASCREYEDWSPEAALGTRDTILLQLAEVLEAQMPFVASAPDDRWQQARLYAPHVATVVSKLSSSDTKPSAVVARLLGCMGQYSKEIALNYPEALQYQKQALKIYQTLHEGDHPDVARALSEIGTTLSQAGQRQEALEYKKQALEMRQRLLQGQDDADLAHALNSVGELLTHLGKHQEALKYKQEALAMRQRLFKDQVHPDVARSLTSVGISLEDLNQLQEALKYKQAALEIRQRVANNQDHSDIAHSLNNVGETLIKLGKAEEGIRYCEQGLEMRKRLFKGKDHPYIAQSLNSLGMGYTALGSYRAAAAHYQQAVEVALRVFKRAHPKLIQYLHNLIETFPKLEATQVQQIKATLVPLCSEVLGEEHALTKDLLAA